MKKKYQTAVERVLNRTPNPGPRRSPDAPIPDELILTDVRRYNVRQLLENVSHSHYITVGTEPPPNRRGRKPGSRNNRSKYSHEDQVWMAHTTVQSIHQRYGYGYEYSRQLQRAAIDYVARNGFDDSH